MYKTREQLIDGVCSQMNQLDESTEKGQYLGVISVLGGIFGAVLDMRDIAIAIYQMKLREDNDVTLH